jgi:YfiH family protein
VNNLEQNTYFTNNENAVLNAAGAVPYLTFPCLSKLPFIRHGFSTKYGGVSKGIFESMNLSYSSGDAPADVDENYRRICAAMGFTLEDVVATHQVHKTVVRVINSGDKGKGLKKPRDYEGVDGFITNEPGIPLATFYADCVPLFLVDTKQPAIGLSHSGWRGTVNRMGQVTLQAMIEQFGTNTEDITVLIGPSICGDCYEVSKDVAEAFSSEFKVGIRDILKKKDNGKYQLNLWEANRRVFLEAGVKEENIHISSVCTCCNSEWLFSHRATMGKRGTMAAFLMINKS